MLDTAFARPSVFKKLNYKSNLKHVRHDFYLSRTANDETIYTLAIKEKRFVITQDRDFKKMVMKNKPGILIIPSYLTNDEIDRLLTTFIVDKDPDELWGKAIKI